MRSKPASAPVRSLPFLGKRIVLGVTGSIAAYKAVGLLRALLAEGADVSVVMTPSATRFVTPLTFEVLSNHPVAIDLFSNGPEMAHLSLPEQADALLVAPATANVLAKCAVGLADDLLSTMMLNAQCPVIFAPAMDGDMWGHPAVRANVETLRARGATVLDPDIGPLASGAVAQGRLPEESAIVAALAARLADRMDWVGQRVLVSAGPTREAIDPVRYLSNRSSGKMGYAVAEAARHRGAEVVLVSGPTALSPPRGVEVASVESAREMREALLARLPWSTVVVMTAAVADFRPVSPSTKKIKKNQRVRHRVELEETEDILGHLAARRTSQLLVGFAAETGPALAQAKDKLKRKGADLIVGNNVSAEGSGFGADTNAAVLVDRHGRVTELALMPKRQLADRILDAIQAIRRASGPQASRASTHRR